MRISGIECFKNKRCTSFQQVVFRFQAVTFEVSMCLDSFAYLGVASRNSDLPAFAFILQADLALDISSPLEASSLKHLSPNNDGERPSSSESTTSSGDSYHPPDKSCPPFVDVDERIVSGMRVSLVNPPIDTGLTSVVYRCAATNRYWTAILY